ncbi:CTP-dependent riboflavin kinase [Candidatus Woesearchaeota archaeon]|nr:CTP-dependent riboflavin kinase [Candidatus Woesearchaeota archaeon]
MANKKIISGIVVRGLGEGTYFMSMPDYQKEIEEKLGFKTYPGTLNLRIDAKKVNLLRNFKKIIIDGFKQGNKTFGGVDCYRAKIKDINGAVIIPHTSKHKKNIIEFIASVHLKSELKLKDGDKISMELLK